MPRDDNRNQSCRWDVYIAAGFGAFCLSIGDLVKNYNSSTVVRLSEAIRTYLISSLGEGALVAIFLVVLLGIIVCWIHGPSNRVEGFARGFSVFAVLAVASPAVKTPSPLVNDNISSLSSGAPVGYHHEAAKTHRTSAISFLTSSAFAQTFQEENNEGEAIIIFTKEPDVSKDALATITLRNIETQEIVARQDIFGAKFRIKKPYGNYLLEIERPGFRRTETPLTIDKPIAAYELSIEHSKIPISIQKFVGFSSGSLTFSPAETSKQEGINHVLKKDYDLAIEKYNEALAIAPDDAQLHNFKGYALFRAGDYDKAIFSFKRAQALSPNYYFARLNLAKAYCAKGDNINAKNTLLSEPKLSINELTTTINDGEFKRVCSEIVGAIELALGTNN